MEREPSVPGRPAAQGMFQCVQTHTHVMPVAGSVRATARSVNDARHCARRRRERRQKRRFHFEWVGQARVPMLHRVACVPMHGHVCWRLECAVYKTSLRRGALSTTRQLNAIIHRCCLGCSVTNCSLRSLHQQLHHAPAAFVLVASKQVGEEGLSFAVPVTLLSNDHEAACIHCIAASCCAADNTRSLS